MKDKKLGRNKNTSLLKEIRKSGNSANYCGVRGINIKRSVKFVWQRDIIGLAPGDPAEK